MILDQEIKEAFLSEARGLVKKMNVSLLKLEKNPKQAEPLVDLLDSLHTFKSLAAAMRLDKTATLCHAMEELLVEIQKKKVPLETCVEILFSCLDALETLVNAVEKGEAEPETAELCDVIPTLSGAKGKNPVDPLDPSLPRRMTNNAQDGKHQDDKHKIEPKSIIEVKVERLDVLMKLTEELLIAKMRLDRVKESAEIPELTAAVDSLARLVTDIQYNVTQARMVPIQTLFERFPRMVRDISKAQGKEVDLILTGGELELDRQVLDQMGEPLVHLLRNAIDHGLEAPDLRKKSGKPATATLRLSAKREKGVAVIEIEDDGKGLNIDAIKNEAIKRGLLSKEANLEETLGVLFSGLSTAQKVTALSGRGLGLNIVKKTVDAIGGNIKIETIAGKGTKFIIELPTTLAIVDTLFVGVGKEKYAIPVSNVVRLLTVKREEIKGQLGYEALIVDKEDLPLVSLRELFHFEAPIAPVQEVVIVRKGEEKFGLGVDTLMATQEIVIKPLGPLVKKNRYFSGSTIVGSGEAILVLDVASLAVMKKKGRVSGSGVQQ